MSADPYSVLGVSPGASIEELRAARRRLAREAHPDRGGDGRRMQEINRAFDHAVAAIRRSRVPQPRPPQPAPSQRAGPPPPGPARRWVPVQHDAPSFTIGALPAEAYEALLVVTSWFGDVLVDDPPYLLEVHVYEPSCWCRLELVPEAGASTVSLTVAGIEGSPVDLEAVRDQWIAALNQLGPDQP